MRIEAMSIGQLAGAGAGTTHSIARPTTNPVAFMIAAEVRLSPATLRSAFQEACSTAASSTRPNTSGPTVREGVMARSPRPHRGSEPRHRVGLDVGEALHRLEHAFLVAEAGILDAAEGRHLDAVAWHLPDIDGADLELAYEAGDVVEAVGADAGGEAEGGGVREADRLVDIVEAHDRRHRPEGLLAHQLALRRHVVEDGRRVERA